MRYVLFADIHANLEAFEEVLAALKKESPDVCLCLGDAVGYGANPNEVLTLLREHAIEMVAGNHDWAVSGKMTPYTFNDDAAYAIEWTKVHLSEPHRDYLARLTLTLVKDDFTLVHASLETPEHFQYVFTIEQAKAHFSAQPTPLSFIGHSHIPGFFVRDDHGITCASGLDIELKPRASYIVNVGSVGQPRDGDPRAAYAVYDTKKKKVSIKRLRYNSTHTQEKIIRAGLPAFLARRLAQGI